MENMGTILVDVDTLHHLAIEISARVRTFVKHEASLTGFFGTISKRSAEQAGSNNYIVVIFHYIIVFILVYPFDIILNIAIRSVLLTPKISIDNIYTMVHDTHKIIKFNRFAGNTSHK